MTHADFEISLQIVELARAGRKIQNFARIGKNVVYNWSKGMKRCTIYTESM